MSGSIAEGIRELRRASAMRALYPEGHPAYAAALARARDAVAGILDGNDRVELLIGGSQMYVNGECVSDSDKVIAELAGRLWELGICELDIQAGLTEAELELLLDISAPSTGELDCEEIKRRLYHIQSAHLRLVELDYSRFVPSSELADAPPVDLGGIKIAEAMRELVAAPKEGGVALDDEQRSRLLALFPYPEALADAIELGVLASAQENPDYLAETEQKEPVAETTDGQSSHISLGAPTSEETAPLEDAGARLAFIVQRLADLTRDLPEAEVRVAYQRLADALRRLDRELVASAYRASSPGLATGDDALARIADCMTIEELVEIVRAKLSTATAEHPPICRDLLERISSHGERLLDLAPALKQALIADGMSEELYASTVGETVNDIVRALEYSETRPVDPLPVALQRASEQDRKARRAELEDRLREMFADGAWIPRVFMSLELLRMTENAAAQSAAAADVKLALQRIPAAYADEVWIQVALELADLIDPTRPVDEHRRQAVGAILTETSTPERIQSLARTFRQEPSDTRRRIIIALRAMGGAGVKQIGTLLQTEQTLTDEDVCGIVRTLVDVQRQGLKSAEEAVRALISPLCAARGKLIRAILAEGGKVGRQWLIEALQKGGDSQRWDIVYAVGQAPAQGVSILQAAMRGHSDYAACAAAKYLGASGSQEAAKVLLPYVRPFTLRDPDYQLRLAVIEALGELKAPEAAEPLSLVLAKKSFWRRRSSDALRLAAARALAAIGTEEALKSLARYARKERNAQIRELARRASQAAAPT